MIKTPSFQCSGCRVCSAGELKSHMLLGLAKKKKIFFLKCSSSEFVLFKVTIIPRKLSSLSSGYKDNYTILCYDR